MRNEEGIYVCADEPLKNWGNTIRGIIQKPKSLLKSREWKLKNEICVSHEIGRDLPQQTEKREKQKLVILLIVRIQFCSFHFFLNSLPKSFESTDSSEINHEPSGKICFAVAWRCGVVGRGGWGEDSGDIFTSTTINMEESYEYQCRESSSSFHLFSEAVGIQRNARGHKSKKVIRQQLGGGRTTTQCKSA